MRSRLTVCVLPLLLVACPDDDKGSTDTTDTRTDTTAQPDGADSATDTTADGDDTTVVDTVDATTDDTQVTETADPDSETVTPVSDFSCLGNDQPHDPGDQDITLSFTLIGYLSDLPIAGVHVTFCERLDDDCRDPIAEVDSDDEGTFSVALPAGFDGHARAQGGGIAPSIQMFDPRITGTPAPDGVPRLVRVINPDELATVADLYEVTLDPDQGRILATARDCELIPAAGLTVELVGAREPVVYDYTLDRLPDPSATASDSTGFGGVFNAPAGSFTMTAALADGRSFGRAPVLVRPGWITAVDIAPHQTTPDLTCDGMPRQSAGIEGELRASIALTSFVTGAPMTGVHVKVCAIGDSACESPVTEGDVDDEGTFASAFDVGGDGFDGYLELTGADTFPTRFFFNPPVRARGEVAPTLVLQVLSTNEVGAFVQISDVTIDSALAQVAILTEDCRFQPMHDVSVTSTALTDASKIVYLADNLPAPAASVTDDAGLAALLNLAVGDAEFSASFGGEVYGSVTLPLVAGFLHIGVVIPGRITYVDAAAAPGGDGSATAPFDDIQDGVDQAMAQGGGEVRVAPGTYAVSNAIQIDGPVRLRGSNVAVYDEAGWPTGEVEPGTETIVTGTAELAGGALISVGSADGGVVDGASVSGFTVMAGPVAGNGIDLYRAQGVTVRNNIVTGGFFIGIFTAAASGRIADNFISVGCCGSCIAAGYPGSPGNMVFEHNRSVQNGCGGVLLNGSATGIAELGDQLDALIRNNDLSENTSPFFGFGTRVFNIRRDPGTPGDTQTAGNVRARFEGNRYHANEMGLVIDAGFPFRTFADACDDRVYGGDFDLTFHDNAITESNLAVAVISMTRISAALEPDAVSAWQYLHGATYTITDPDEDLAGFVVEHQERDPFVGECANDADQEELSNTIIYNGETLPYSRAVEFGDTCADGLDNDNDGLSDCDDLSTCATDDFCVEIAGECLDEDDNDGDGDADCMDSDCTYAPSCFSGGTDLGSELQSPIAMGTTVDGSDDFLPACAAPGSNDVAFRWTAPEDGTYSFDTFGSDYDTVLALFSRDGDGCNDQAGDSDQSEITLTLSAGTEVVIFIDGWAGVNGAYALNISKPSP